jgi:hypothetical protein
VWRTAPATIFDSEAWLRLIIRIIFTNGLDLWTIQNNKSHGIDDQAKKSLHAAQVKHNLQALYLMQPSVLAADRIFTIRQWVLSHHQIIHRSRREARHCSTYNLKLLPKYFHPLKSGKLKRKYYRSVPTTVPVYESTRISDHFPNTPSIPNPVIRSDQQLAHLICNFQQLPLIFGGDHPT